MNLIISEAQTFISLNEKTMMQKEQLGQHWTRLQDGLFIIKDDTNVLSMLKILVTDQDATFSHKSLCEGKASQRWQTTDC